MDVFKEIVFVNEFLVDARQHDADVFWSVEWGLEVEVFNVEGDKMCALTGENAVENEFYENKRCGLGVDVAGVSDILAGDDDASAVGVSLLRSDATNALREGDALAAVGRGGVFVA